MYTTLPKKTLEVPEQVSYASLSDRVKSIFIDTVCIVVVMFVFAGVLDNFDNAPEWLHIAMFIAIWFLYEPVMVSLGCTVGQYIIHIRVRKATDTTKHINILQSYIRYIIKMLLGWISFLSIAASDKRTAVHDLVVGSVMIKV